MFKETWREALRPHILKVIARVGTDDRRQLRAELREAYPLHSRRCYPYRIWCHEIRVQLGEVQFPKPRRRTLKSSPGQRKLFKMGDNG